MLRNGSTWRLTALLLLGGLALLAACGDKKPAPRSPKDHQAGGKTGQGAGGGEGLPPLEEVDPADHDIEVPPAP